MKPPKAASCRVRLIEDGDFLELERMYCEHEGISLPKGYFEDFQETIRNPAVDYFVATFEDRVVGGGGVSNYLPGVQATLTFGIVDPAECRKGYGTSIMLSRLLFIDPGSAGCQIVVEATEWSSPFFNRLGFSWYDHNQDEAGNRFFFGTHTVYPGDERVFRRILADGPVTLGFAPDRPTTAEPGAAGQPTTRLESK